MSTVLILGSAPMAVAARDWPRAPFDLVVAINNAHALRPDWDHMIYPWDFPADRLPQPGPGQTLIGEDEFVPAQNALGGFVYAGGTMAFTAAYWALAALKPKVIAVFGCDMQYPTHGPSHFYGQGTPDPLRRDITLRALESKSARLQVMGARQGCALVNLSNGPSRLVFPRVPRENADLARPLPYDTPLAARALQREADLGYFVASGRYWEDARTFDPQNLDALDALWLSASQTPDLHKPPFAP